MKTISRCLMLACGVLALGCVVGYSDLKQLADDLVGDDFDKQRSALYRLHGQGKVAIPLLVDAIDCQDSLILALQNPLSSSIDERALVNRCGVLVAYVVELILGRETLARDSTAGVGLFLGGAPECLDNYLYHSGIIVRRDGQSFTSEDMSKVKAVYSAWWEKNKNESLRQLRIDWRDGNRPLTGSDYVWE